MAPNQQPLSNRGDRVQRKTQPKGQSHPPRSATPCEANIAGRHPHLSVKTRDGRTRPQVRHLNPGTTNLFWPEQRTRADIAKYSRRWEIRFVEASPSDPRVNRDDRDPAGVASTWRTHRWWRLPKVTTLSSY